MIPAPRNALVSFHYFSKYNLDRLAGLRLIGDSGAFSAASQGVTITPKDLAGWARQWSHRLAWVASLDVIGDAAGTRKNWHELVDIHGIEAVPTIHFGAPPTDLDYYGQRGVDFVGLGGMVGHKSSKDKLLRWIVQVMRYARDNWPAMRFHGWGVTAPQLIRAPFFSVDSSGWAAGMMFGRLTVSDPTSKRDIKIALNGKDAYHPEPARILRDHYGINPSAIATSSGANRADVVRACALSASVAEMRMRKMHPVISAPVWGSRILVDAPVPTPADGPHQHIVAGASGNTQLDFLADKKVDGPHMHMASTATPYLEQMSAEAGPHQHMAIKSDQGEVIAPMVRQEDGPHLHLASSAAEDLERARDANGPHMHLATTARDTETNGLTGLLEERSA
ncbi:hypothetical protein [Rhodococcoides fascians]|uniref:hypothetical protein n=1 Tax=Rhodococcoides fascians TaxID=1828 RepID=UPI00068D78A5|nr:hypothetical protein [Rhodococcus fascians]